MDIAIQNNEVLTETNPARKTDDVISFLPTFQPNLLGHILSLFPLLRLVSSSTEKPDKWKRR